MPGGSRLFWFLAQRVAVFLATLVVAAALIFALLRVPADPRNTGDSGFFDWLGGMLAGNFGLSASGTRVGPMVAGALSVTLPLAALALLLSLAVGAAMAWFAARSRAGWTGRALTALAAVGVAVPNLWLGMLLVLVFALGLDVFPTGGFVPWGQNFFGALASLILPALALALPKGAALAQRGRVELLEVNNAGYVRAARVRGLSEIEALRWHGLRNGLLGLLRPLGIEISTLIAGTLVVENVFYLPGLGQLIFNGIVSGDLAPSRAGLVVLVLTIAVANLALRLGEGWVDPRLVAEAGP